MKDIRDVFKTSELSQMDLLAKIARKLKLLFL